MTNAELIKTLRYCISDEYVEKGCLICPICAPRQGEMKCNSQDDAIKYAADALEAAEKRIEELEAQMPKEGEWLRTGAFPHRVYCSCCYKTYVPNENWQIWQDDADNFGLPRNYCPNCGARMKGANDADN